MSAKTKFVIPPGFHPRGWPSRAMWLSYTPLEGGSFKRVVRGSVAEEPPRIILAGFIGWESNWSAFEPEWKVALGQRPYLHMSDLRWGQKVKTGKLLNRLGPIPYRQGLLPVMSIVQRNFYNATFG